MVFHIFLLAYPADYMTVPQLSETKLFCLLTQLTYEKVLKIIFHPQSELPIFFLNAIFADNFFFN